MKAVVLVGGFGTRLRPLTLTTPKQMLPVIDRPMIEHVVGWLGSAGVTDAVLALGYRPEAFTTHYTDGLCAGVRLHYAVEDHPLDTAGAIRFAAHEAGFAGERLLAINGDVLTDLDLTGLWDLHQESGAEATIALTPVDDPSRYGVVPTDDENRVLGFIEKPPADEAPTNWINAGSYVFEPSVLEGIPADIPVSVERETFPALARRRSLYALRSDAYWVDTGTPLTYLKAQLDMVDGTRDSLPPVHPGAVVDDEAYVYRSVIMDGAIIRSGARVENSVVSPSAVIEQNAVVRDSIIGSGALVQNGAVVADYSVIGSDVSVTPGAELGGVRLPDPG
ncbi:MAG: NDP-sugar synthase [Acidobacteria bacterium]|nr:NDP-sugar synthase [Acidobacteriota bacterium]